MYWLPFFQAKTETIPLFISTVLAYFNKTVKKGIALVWKSLARPKHCPLCLSWSLWEVLKVYGWLFLVSVGKGELGRLHVSLFEFFFFLWLLEHSGYGAGAALGPCSSVLLPLPCSALVVKTVQIQSDNSVPDLRAQGLRWKTESIFSLSDSVCFSLTWFFCKPIVAKKMRLIFHYYQSY